MFRHPVMRWLWRMFRHRCRNMTRIPLMRNACRSFGRPARGFFGRPAAGLSSATAQTRLPQIHPLRVLPRPLRRPPPFRRRACPAGSSATTAPRPPLRMRRAPPSSASARIPDHPDGRQKKRGNTAGVLPSSPGYHPGVSGVRTRRPDVYLRMIKTQNENFRPADTLYSRVKCSPSSRSACRYRRMLSAACQSTPSP